MSSHQPSKWQGSCSFYPGITSFGIFDYDPQFQQDAERAASWVAGKLGYPNLDVELSDQQIFDNFEQSVYDYGAEITRANMINNMFALQGKPTSSVVDGRYVYDGVANIATISEQYGAVIGGKGGQRPTLTRFQTTESVQRYNLEDFGFPPRIEITNIYDWQIPASLRMYSPFFGGSMLDLLSFFGLAEAGVASVGMVYPLHLQILRTQATELADMFYRSSFRFQIVGNQLQITPVPTETKTMWIEWFDISTQPLATANDSITDLSNMPYSHIKYSNINAAGKSWIRKYFLSLCKETLGRVRSKFQSVSLPEGDVSLDGDTLLQEGKQEQEELLTSLRTDLELLRKDTVYRREADAAQALSDLLNFVPLRQPFFWG